MGYLGLGARAPAGAQSLGKGCGGTKRRARICDHDHRLKITPRPPHQGGGGRSEDFQSGCYSLSIKRGPLPMTPLTCKSCQYKAESERGQPPSQSHGPPPRITEERASGINRGGPLYASGLLFCQGAAPEPGLCHRSPA